MPRLRIGQDNPAGATCPVCGTVLTLRTIRRLYGPAWTCPVALSESFSRRTGYNGRGSATLQSQRKPTAKHSTAWDFSSSDLALLVSGQPTAWHLYQQSLAALDAGDYAEHKRLLALTRAAS